MIAQHDATGKAANMHDPGKAGGAEKTPSGATVGKPNVAGKGVAAANPSQKKKAVAAARPRVPRMGDSPCTVTNLMG